MGKLKIEVFLTHLAVEKNVSPSTQNQALNALVFLYEHVLELSLKEAQITSVRAKQKIHIPVVLSTDELKRILFYTSGIYKLMLMLLYGCGLRLSELLRLRVKDIDFALSNVCIFDSKSGRDRVVPLHKKYVKIY